MKNIILLLVAVFVAATSAQMVLQPGFTYTSSNQARSWNYYGLRLSDATINYVQLVADTLSVSLSSRF